MFRIAPLLEPNATALRKMAPRPIQSVRKPLN